jgi:hypothetical protein
LIRDHGTAALYATHDLSVFAQIADRILVLRHGRMVETAHCADQPQHPRAGGRAAGGDERYRRRWAVECLGSPVVELLLSADKPLGQIAVRLCDVAPDGASQRVSYGVLNLAHRNGSAAPESLVPGEPVRVVLPLKVLGHRFAAGHRIRFAVSTAYWPILWPAPYAATITLDLRIASPSDAPERQARCLI